jgi:hypothetical protein
VSNYNLQGSEIFSDKGRLVATLDSNGNIVMAPGMAGPHSHGVREFVENLRSAVGHIEQAENSVVKENLTTETPVGTLPGMNEQTFEEWSVDTIAEEDLPPFSKELGINTPGFAEYIKQHNFNEPQTEALVKRLSE